MDERIKAMKNPPNYPTTNRTQDLIVNRVKKLYRYNKL
jgi:hypothetical protein